MPVTVTWPRDTLPYLVQKDQFNFNPGSGMIRDEVDAGYPIVRRRFTATVDTYTIAIVMNYSEFVTFKNFFKNSPGHPDLAGVLYGSVLLYFPEPLWQPDTDETEDDRPNSLFRWVSEKGQNPYTASPDGDTSSFVVSFKLEKIPNIEADI